MVFPKLDNKGSLRQGMEYEVIDRLTGVERRVGSSVDDAAGCMF